MARLPDPAVRRRWEKLVRLFDGSDLTVAEFCEQQGVSTASFYLWRRKIRGRTEEPGVFVPVSVPVPVTVPVSEEAGRECFRIHLGGRAVVEIPSCETAALLSVVDRLNENAGRPGQRGSQS
ncbi:MAG: hypothetical protein R3C19_27165 [Planctomycetaceae bacterium]